MILLFSWGFFIFTISKSKISRGYVPSTLRYRKEVIAGYVIPAVWTIITAIVNQYGDICDSTHPRIGIGACFFSTTYGNIIGSNILLH